MKDIIEMALKAGFLSRDNSSAMYSESDFDGEICMEEYAVGERLKRFAELVRADERNSWPAEMEAMERQVNILTDALAQEREACAKVCDDWAKTSYLSEAKSCARNIRARSNA